MPKTSGQCTITTRNTCCSGNQRQAANAPRPINIEAHNTQFLPGGRVEIYLGDDLVQRYRDKGYDNIEEGINAGLDALGVPRRKAN